VARARLERDYPPVRPRQPREQERVVADVRADVELRRPRPHQLDGEAGLLRLVGAVQDAQHLAAAVQSPPDAAERPAPDRESKHRAPSWAHCDLPPRGGSPAVNIAGIILTRPGCGAPPRACAGRDADPNPGIPRARAMRRDSRTPGPALPGAAGACASR